MPEEFEHLLISMQQEVQNIEINRRERNKKYLDCVNEYMDHLKAEIKQFETGQESNDKCKGQISQVFKMSHERILQGVTITEAKIRQTYHEKLKFWTASRRMAELYGNGKVNLWCQENAKVARQTFHEVLVYSNEQKPTYEQLFIHKPTSGHELKLHQTVNRLFEGQALPGNPSVNRSQTKFKVSKQPETPPPGNGLYSQGSIQTNFLDNFMIDRR